MWPEGSGGEEWKPSRFRELDPAARRRLLPLAILDAGLGCADCVVCAAQDKCLLRETNIDASTLRLSRDEIFKPRKFRLSERFTARSG